MTDQTRDKAIITAVLWLCVFFDEFLDQRLRVIAAVLVICRPKIKQLFRVFFDNWLDQRSSCYSCNAITLRVFFDD